MLAAVDANGNPVVLAGPDAKQIALSVKKTSHFCPQCGRPVVIKAGDVNIPHFAHESYSSCDSFSEHESPRHLSAKLDLFNWITRTHDAMMEARLPDGSQRPDILSGTIAVEYQCSTISASLFRVRTEKYRARGLKPFWIYGGPSIERKGRYVKLTPFQRLFLRYHAQLGFYLITYCPDLKLFTIYERIVPVTMSLCLAERLDVKVEDMMFPPSAAFSADFSFSLAHFFDEKRKWIDRSLYYSNARTHPFFRTVYESGRNPYFLPEEIGLPVRSGMTIRNHAAEWQFYIAHDRKSGSAIEAAKIIRRRIQMGHLKEMIMPLAPMMTPEQAAEDYVVLLNGIEIERRMDSQSMAGKIRREEEFCLAHEKRIVNRLIF
jgi:competence protein CoiA